MTKIEAVACSDQQTNRDKYNSIVDERTLYEIYAAPFLRAIMAGVVNVMCSSNLVNGTYACENANLLNSILKLEFGFEGAIMSDWYATHSTISAQSGLDMTIPGDITQGSGTSYFGENLVNAVKNGAIGEPRVDDMAMRVLSAWLFLGQNGSYPGPNFNSNKPPNDPSNKHTDVQADHDTLVRQIDAASAILLKNVKGALPLKAPRSITLFGSDAGPARRAGPNGFTNQAGADGVLASGWAPG